VIQASLHARSAKLHLALRIGSTMYEQVLWLRRLRTHRIGCRRLGLQLIRAAKRRLGAHVPLMRCSDLRRDLEPTGERKRRSQAKKKCIRLLGVGHSRDVCFLLSPFLSLLHIIFDWGGVLFSWLTASYNTSAGDRLIVMRGGRPTSAHLLMRLPPQTDWCWSCLL